VSGVLVVDEPGWVVDVPKVPGGADDDVVAPVVGVVPVVVGVDPVDVVDAVVGVVLDPLVDDVVLRVVEVVVVVSCGLPAAPAEAMWRIDGAVQAAAPTAPAPRSPRRDSRAARSASMRAENTASRRYGHMKSAN
jgi:hypothetical protein